MPVTLIHPVREAAKLGAEHGTTAATWWDVDSTMNAQNVIDADNNCELGDWCPSPLSGEFADGYSVSELTRDCTPFDPTVWPLVWEDTLLLDRMLTTYEDAYYAAWSSSVVARATAYLAS